LNFGCTKDFVENIKYLKILKRYPLFCINSTMQKYKNPISYFSKSNFPLTTWGIEFEERGDGK